jgi:oxidoreductase
MEYTKLNNGMEMPMLGYGVFQIPDEQTAQCVADALSVGYRLIDTAQAYGNEKGVGEGIKRSGVSRSDIFLVDKVWMSHYDYDGAKASIDRSLQLLGTDYIDLMLLHQPFGDVYGAYRAMTDAHREGKIHALGVSNFPADRFIDFASHVEIAPAVNQVEANVFNQEPGLQKWLDEWGTRMMGWGPLAEGKNGFFTNPVLEAIGKKYGKSVAQVALRFLLQLGIIIIPKSVKIERMRQNFDLFDFTLDADDMAAIKKLDTGKPFIIGSHEDPEVVKWFMQFIKD